MNISVPEAAVAKGPDVTWGHIDGPLLHWAGNTHWLTFGERAKIWLRLSSVDHVACARWPHLAIAREKLRIRDSIR